MRLTDTISILDIRAIKHRFQLLWNIQNDSITKVHAAKSFSHPPPPPSPQPVEI